MKDPGTGGYAWDAADYARHSGGQYAWAQELLDKLALAPDERVLDIGCGDGKVTAALAGHVPQGRALGVDVSPEMIRLARARHPQAAYPNLSFLLMDARRLCFTEQFEVAFSNAALHWVRDHPAVLHGVAAALRRGGRLLFQMGGRGNAPDMFALLDEMLAGEPWRRYFVDFPFPFGFYGPEAYRGWLPLAGLSPIRLELLAKDMRHAGREGLAGWIRTTWLPYTQRLPEDLR
ncbi:MAG TPA: methyltransferase domain-containing protein, partial [Anaerolineae bacterium]